MDVRFRFPRFDDAARMGEVHTRSWQAAYAGLVDADALAALDPDNRRLLFEAIIGGEDERFAHWDLIVATIDDEPVGHVGVSCAPGDERGEFVLLYLHPDHQGTGIGSVLHDMGLRSLSRRGATEARLNVMKGNDPSIAFYERRGWSFTGVEKQESLFGIDVIDVEMTRPLQRDTLEANRSYWDAKAPWYASRQEWNDRVDWGIYGITDEAAGHIFPEVDGLDVVELGCGTGYVSYWAHLRGARSITGIDNSPAQLATAAERAASKDVLFPTVLGDAQRLPYADNSFDVAINEYGAAIWCDPRQWIPEAARVLRPGGLVWFLGNSVQVMLCAPEFEGETASPAMLRPQRDMHRFEWIDTENVEFHVSHGEMIWILTGAGFVVEALHELYAEPDMTNAYGFVDGEWASKWPVEDVWVARLAD